MRDVVWCSAKSVGHFKIESQAGGVAFEWGDVNPGASKG